MKICIAGWYYRPRFLQMVRDSGYRSFMVQHREGDTQGIDAVLTENRGLEFGCYREYALKYWDGVSDVLFCHDDAEVTSTKAFADVERLGEMGVEHAYIFHDEYDELVNGGAHGRGMFIAASLLKKIAGDFPADMQNDGVNIGKTAQKGILAFHERVMALSNNAGVIAIIPQFRFAFRGRLHEEMFVYRKTTTMPRGEVLVAE